MALRTRVIDAQRNDSKNEKGQINGYVVSLYKDWEKVLKAEPKQIYLNICMPGEKKGPHLHMNRWDYFATIRGSVRFVIKYGPGDYEEVDVHCKENGHGIKIVEVPPAIPCLMINIGSDEAWVLNMPNPAWHPENQDSHPVSYEDYRNGPTTRQYLDVSALAPVAEHLARAPSASRQGESGDVPLHGCAA